MTRLLMLILLLTACTDRARDLPPDRWRGAVLMNALPKPAVTLTATDGQPFDLRERTAGTVTLLFFGFTNCPDICPVHMANLGAVLRDYAPSVRQRISVVFVTTDPARDSLPRLREWLNNFDRDFIGLWGEAETVNRAQAALGLPPSILGTPDSTGRYDVGHSAVVVAFTPDDSARFVYPFGIRQADWANDLPQLLAW
ncbi:MAG: SCO family protein [Gemmatimonadales bacterium]